MNPDRAGAATAETVTLYRLLLDRPRFAFDVERTLLPENGIYLYFERGELVPVDGVTAERIVRVGTHRQSGRFQQRIRQHYGNVASLGGNKNASVFRRHVGSALLRRADPDDPRLAGWLRSGGAYPSEVEALVSQTLRDTFVFACFPVESATERLALESGLIALLAQRPLGAPSAGWLGRDAADRRIRESGLWNTQHLTSAPLSAEQLVRIQHALATR